MRLFKKPFLFSESCFTFKLDSAARPRTYNGAAEKDICFSEIEFHEAAAPKRSEI